jgi:hypothetical protein
VLLQFLFVIIIKLEVCREAGLPNSTQPGDASLPVSFLLSSFSASLV